MTALNSAWLSFAKMFGFASHCTPWIVEMYFTALRYGIGVLCSRSARSDRTRLRLMFSPSMVVQSASASAGFSFRHLRTLPTSEGVSEPASTSASMSRVCGGSLKGSTR